MNRLLKLSIAALIIGWSSLATAEDLVQVETVLPGLNNPTGVAVQPETGDLFVADSGAAKIIRYNVKDKKAEDVITGFTLDKYGKGPTYDIGPLGLAFLDKNTLVVSDGGKVDEEELVYVFEVPEAGKSIAVDAAKQKLGPLGKTDDSQAEGNYYALAITKDRLFTTANGDDTKGWIAMADLKDGKFENFRRGVATKVATEVDAPVALAISPKGRLVVGQCGEVNVPGDSLLTWYSVPDGKLLMKLKTGLHDLAGLAYGPTGKALGYEGTKPVEGQLLYGVDYAWAKPEEGGLFRLDDDGKKNDDPEKAVAVTRLATLDKPSALAFADDGTLYVTVFGTAKEGEEAKPGALLKITAKGPGSSSQP
ncbi:MAG: hypothetical protein WD875_19435 [Pirellulales bacterium]